MRTDDPDVDDRLSKAVGRPVRLASTAPDDRAFEEVWPDIGGLAPDDVIQGTTIGTEESGGRTLELGGSGSESGVRLSVAMPAMRCIMTTLPQDDLPRDRETLRTIADHNRVEIPGFFGTWACAGSYADVSSPGSIAVGATVAVE